MTITHSFVSTNTDGSDASLVQKNAWNGDHATSELTTSKVLVPDGAGGMEWVSYLQLGTGPFPTTGDIRFGETASLVAWSSGVGANIPLIQWDEANARVSIDSVGYGTQFNSAIYAPAISGLTALTIGSAFAGVMFKTQLLVSELELDLLALPTTNPSITGRVWNNFGVLCIS